MASCFFLSCLPMSLFSTCTLAVRGGSLINETGVRAKIRHVPGQHGGHDEGHNL